MVPDGACHTVREMRAAPSEKGAPAKLSSRSGAPLLAAYRCEHSDRIPVWFMRQAGRFLSEYRVDAAILFSDITVPLAAIGVEVEIVAGLGPAMDGEPLLWRRPVSARVETALAALRAQVQAGASAVQVLESWAGVLDPDSYQAFVRPAARRIFAGLADLGVPRVRFGVGTGELLLQLLAAAGADVVGVDWRVRLDVTRSRLGPGAPGSLCRGISTRPRAWVPGRSSANERYRAIGGSSPLLEITRAQARGLEELLSRGDGGAFRVALGIEHAPWRMSWLRRWRRRRSCGHAGVCASCRPGSLARGARARIPQSDPWPARGGQTRVAPERSGAHWSSLGRRDRQPAAALLGGPCRTNAGAQARWRDAARARDRRAARGDRRTRQAAGGAPHAVGAGAAAIRHRAPRTRRVDRGSDHAPAPTRACGRRQTPHERQSPDIVEIAPGDR